MKRAKRTRSGAPGILDVAKSAGVSPATVSRFFNSPEVVKRDTKKRIEQAATELGYIRDRMAGAMHSRFSGTIGLVVPTINNAIFSELIAAFSQRLLEHDRTMLVASNNYDLHLEASIIRSLLERRIDGVAVVGHNHLGTTINMLSVRSIPVIALWGYQRDPAIPFIGANNRLAAYKVTQHLLELGHSDIAFIFPETSNNDRAAERQVGAMQAMKDAHIAVPQTRMLTCPYDIGKSKQAARALIKRDKPTAVVCGNDVIAHGVIYAAHEAGLTLPNELSIVGIGDFAGSADIVPSLTTVRLPANRIGQLAADSIVQMIENTNTTVVSNTVVDTELICRNSTCGV